MKSRSNNPESEKSNKDTLKEQPFISSVVPTLHQSKLPLVLLLIFLLFLFGFGRILLGKSLNVSQNISPTPTLGPKPTVVPTTTPDATANWKTYKNEKLGFSFKYPNNWKVVISSEDKEYTVNSLGYIAPQDFELKENIANTPGAPIRFFYY